MNPQFVVLLVLLAKERIQSNICGVRVAGKVAFVLYVCVVARNCMAIVVVSSFLIMKMERADE
jgi:hypothetical protein